MPTIHMATTIGPMVVTGAAGGWRLHQPLRGTFGVAPDAAPCIAVDRRRPNRVYFGRGDSGLWVSEDAGQTWRTAFEPASEDLVTAVAVGPPETDRGVGVEYVGTEPSAVYRSDDAARTWDRCGDLVDLPSSPDWSFPPRPETHHVRWIESDVHDPDRLYVAIEAGALITSPDRGDTWRDRVGGGPRDTHQLLTHPSLPGRLWAAAGDGFFESDDAGSTWRKAEDGLRHAYCWSVALDCAEPGLVLLSAAGSAREAHDEHSAEAHLYRRSKGESRWEEIRNGLPDSGATRAYVVAAHPTLSGTFFAGADGVLLRSVDAGRSWRAIDATKRGIGSGVRIDALAVAEAP